MSADPRPLVDLAAIGATRARLTGWVLRTPLVAMGGSGVLLKAESLQPTGSFKVRGAFGAIGGLDGDARARGVVAHSSGNHAQAVAFAAARLGVSATIVMPDDAPAVKLERTRAAGATVIVVGPASDERSGRAAEIAAAEGRTMVEPYDSDSVITATATIALEILEDAEAMRLTEAPLPGGDVERVAPLELYVPISGGGLAAGVATATKLTDPTVRVIGVEPELAADAQESLARGERVAWPAEAVARTLADGLRVRQVGARPWPHLQAHLDEVVTVSEEEIRAAMRTVAWEARLVAEPSGAVAAAAALAGRGGAGGPPQRRVAILSGGNVEPATYLEVLAG